MLTQQLFSDLAKNQQIKTKIKQIIEVNKNSGARDSISPVKAGIALGIVNVKQVSQEDMDIEQAIRDSYESFFPDANMKNPPEDLNQVRYHISREDAQAADPQDGFKRRFLAEEEVKRDNPDDEKQLISVTCDGSQYLITSEDMKIILIKILKLGTPY